MLFHFFGDTLNFQLSNQESIAVWLCDVVKAESSIIQGEINVIFCTDDELLEINKRFLNHNFYTDIITFPIEQTEDTLEAELYISIDRVKENAKKLSVEFHQELNRVMVHGVLHLCGFGDKGKEEKKEMRLKEDEYLAQLS